MRYPKYLVASVLAIFAVLLAPGLSLAHCEIPCGIYDDEARLDLMAEHITTIEKSMTEITALSAAGNKNYNQLVRWVMNKEDHADKYMEIVTQYFMTQRLKPVEPTDAGYDKYVKSVTLLQQMLVSAMKCKQTTDSVNTAKLKQLLDEFKTLYLGDQGHSH